jgi:hypothetical protein
MIKQSISSKTSGRHQAKHSPQFWALFECKRTTQIGVSVVDPFNFCPCDFMVPTAFRRSSAKVLPWSGAEHSILYVVKSPLVDFKSEYIVNRKYGRKLRRVSR